MEICPAPSVHIESLARQSSGGQLWTISEDVPANLRESSKSSSDTDDIKLEGDTSSEVKQKRSRQQSKATAPKRKPAAFCPDKVCNNCGTMRTPVWRFGGKNKDVLMCNACSLRLTRMKAKVPLAKPVNDDSFLLALRAETDSNSPLQYHHPERANGTKRAASTSSISLREQAKNFIFQEKNRLLGDLYGPEPDMHMWHSYPREMQARSRRTLVQTEFEFEPYQTQSCAVRQISPFEEHKSKDNYWPTTTPVLPWNGLPTFLSLPL